ncbi:restriction endonuclease subunit S [Calothrix sp. FACHB-1219]|uniref:restriction endonuclease subunit S n=1 Tax=unclassified Calothrix TaxID=2619626 RepID=UPI00168666A5|nr:MULTISPECIES: restriction endonuclease subunit S [unclassified Calothrix]MBD2205282.1 restriction endonuclease subunit S [Calothrix sp. FACHB-168]MBD2220055.1 restriction endonuclease subunit S [Calothrix sp. FACHB-1219]
MREVLVRNEAFKDSALGKIPTDWEICTIENKLQQIIDYRGKTPEKTNSGIPLITAKNVRDGYLDPEPREYIDEKNYDIWMRRGFPKSEDVLFTTEAPLGNVARVPSYKIALAQRLLTLRASPEELDAGYLFWLLNWSESRRRLEQKSTGSTVLGIKQSVFRKIFFRFPSLPEQRRIAEILDTVDEAIARTSSLIIKLKQTKAGLLQDLLTRGLDEDGKLRDPQAHPEQFKDSALGRIPKQWEVRKMEEITTKIVDGVHKTPVYVESGIPFLTVENLTAGTGISLKNVRYVTPLDHAEFTKRADPKSGDVLVTKDGTLGIARIVPDDLPEFSIFVSVAQLRPDETFVLPSFICTFFDTGEYEQQLGYRSAGTGLKHIHLEHFRAFLLAVPPIPEQSRIAAIIDTHDNRIRTEEAYLNKLKLQKQGLMQDLLTGKVRVKNL